MTITYSSLAVFEVIEGEFISISSISVTKDESVLSGAWVLPLTNSEEIGLVLSGKLAFPVGSARETLKIVDDFDLVTPDFRDFFAEAKRDAANGMVLFRKFKDEEPVKRKKMVAPIFYDWPEEIDLSDIKSEIKRFGLLQGIQGTDPKMEKVLTAARLIKFFVDQWLSDESQRTSKKYVDGESGEVTILPKLWLSLIF